MGLEWGPAVIGGSVCFGTEARLNSTAQQGTEQYLALGIGYDMLKKSIHWCPERLKNTLP